MDENPFIIDPYYINANGEEAGILSKVRVNKEWGYEDIVENFMYCGKLLHIDCEKQTSKHFHLNKTETLYITVGELEVHIFNKLNSKSNIVKLQQRDAFRIVPGLVHILRCPSTSAYVELIEFSTYSEDADSVRIN